MYFCDNLLLRFLIRRKSPTFDQIKNIRTSNIWSYQLLLEILRVDLFPTILWALLQVPFWIKLETFDLQKFLLLEILKLTIVPQTPVVGKVSSPILNQIKSTQTFKNMELSAIVRNLEGQLIPQNTVGKPEVCVKQGFESCMLYALLDRVGTAYFHLELEPQKHTKCLLPRVEMRKKLDTQSTRTSSKNR